MYFILERLTDKNGKFWRDYVDAHTPGRGGSLELDGWQSFKWSIKELRNTDVWVAYVASKGPRPQDLSQSERTKITRLLEDIDYWTNDKNTLTSQNGDAEKIECSQQNIKSCMNILDHYLRKDRKDENDIEMCVTLLIDPEYPITTHMGIFRNFSHEAQHAGLSLQLHAFIAKNTNHIYAKGEAIEKHYMVTRPASVMREILQNEFTQGIEMAIGSAEDRRKDPKLGPLQDSFLQDDPSGIWRIPVNGTDFEFVAPRWFPKSREEYLATRGALIGEELKRREEIHDDLNSLLPAVTIPIAAMAKRWDLPTG